MNSGDTAWLLMSCAMVLLMTPGLAFFYAGLVPERAVLNTMKMSFIAMGVIAIEWAVVGYSMAFSPSTGLVGGLEWLGLAGVTAKPSEAYASTVPHLVFMAFQMMFAVITPALISGAVVGRMKFKPYVLFILLWAVLIYNPLAHWVWGGGWIGAMGALDFAGGTVVHISAGVSAFVAALIVGPRTGAGPDPVEVTGSGHQGPHNVPFVLLGTGLLWFGWFGFNAGSSLAADGVAATAFVNTMLAASMAIVTCLVLDVFRVGKTSAVGMAVGAVVGLVAITPAAGFVTPMAAIMIGGIAAAVSYYAMIALKRFGVDDTLDVFACHGMGGIVGALLTGVFATTEVNSAGANGLLYGNPGLLVTQLISVVAAAALAAVGTAAILYTLKTFMSLRVSAEEEAFGLDLAEHGEVGYARELKPEPTP